MLGGMPSSPFLVLPEPKVPESMSEEEHGTHWPGSNRSGPGKYVCSVVSDSLRPHGE